MRRQSILLGMAMLAITGCGAPKLLVQGKPPVIQTVSAESDDIQAGAGIQVFSQVEADSKRLSYSWQTSHGLIAQPSEASTYWFAPSSVPYSPFPVTIILTVKDEFGRSVKTSYQVRVYRPSDLPGGALPIGMSSPD
jgi:hypothetical protein